MNIVPPLPTQGGKKTHSLHFQLLLSASECPEAKEMLEHYCVERHLRAWLPSHAILHFWYSYSRLKCRKMRHRSTSINSQNNNWWRTITIHMRKEPSGIIRVVLDAGVAERQPFSAQLLTQLCPLAVLDLGHAACQAGKA